MKTLREYIRLVEEAEGKYVYHGGSFAGGEYNAAKVGEPGNIRPLGIGIYAAPTVAEAEHYVRYAGSNGAVRRFRIKTGARIYPWGGAAWRAASAEEQQYWREKNIEIQRAFEQAGFARYNDRTKQYAYWTDAVSMGNGNKEAMRKLLVSLGVDGAEQHIGDTVEYVFYNTAVLIPE